MQEEFEAVIDETKYLFKRMYHEELDLTYHIHVEHNKVNLIFRMGAFGDQWEILTQKLPIYIYKAKNELTKVIQENEALSSDSLTS